MFDVTQFAPVATAGITGFPERVGSVGHARTLIEAQRLPSIRSHYVWLDAYNRLTLAAASRSAQDVAAARTALARAVGHEQDLHERDLDAEGLALAA